MTGDGSQCGYRCRNNEKPANKIIWRRTKGQVGDETQHIDSFEFHRLLYRRSVLGCWCMLVRDLHRVHGGATAAPSTCVATCRA